MSVNVYENSKYVCDLVVSILGIKPKKEKKYFVVMIFMKDKFGVHHSKQLRVTSCTNLSRRQKDEVGKVCKNIYY